MRMMAMMNIDQLDSENDDQLLTKQPFDNTLVPDGNYDEKKGWGKCIIER